MAARGHGKMGLHTLLTVRFDFPVGWLAVHWGGSLFLLLFLLFIMVLEAFYLYAWAFDTWRRSLGAAVLMNVVSSLLGWGAGLAAAKDPVAARPGSYAGVPEIVAWYQGAGSVVPGVTAVSFFLWVSLALSILSEGLVLGLLASRTIPGRRLWLMNGMANGASYLLWFSLLVWWPGALEPLLGFSLFALLLTFNSIYRFLYRFGPWLGVGLVYWGFWRLVKRMITG